MSSITYRKGIFCAVALCLFSIASLGCTSKEEEKTTTSQQNAAKPAGGEQSQKLKRFVPSKAGAPATSGAPAQGAPAPVGNAGNEAISP